MQKAMWHFEKPWFSQNADLQPFDSFGSAFRPAEFFEVPYGSNAVVTTLWRYGLCSPRQRCPVGIPG